MFRGLYHNQIGLTFLIDPNSYVVTWIYPYSTRRRSSIRYGLAKELMFFFSSLHSFKPRWWQNYVDPPDVIILSRSWSRIVDSWLKCGRARFTLETHFRQPDNLIDQIKRFWTGVPGKRLRSAPSSIRDLTSSRSSLNTFLCWSTACTTRRSSSATIASALSMK
jgi:hypothetical protein